MGSELNDPSAIAPPLRPAEMFKVWSPCCNNQSGWFFLVPRLAHFLSAIQSWMISWVKRKYVSSSVITCHQILTFVLGTTLGRPRHRRVPASTWREIALQKYRSCIAKGWPVKCGSAWKLYFDLKLHKFINFREKGRLCKMSVESVPKDLRQLRACLVSDLNFILEISQGCMWLKRSPRCALSSNRLTNLSLTAVTTARLSFISKTTGLVLAKFCRISFSFSRDNIYDCTSANFDGMIASCKPEDSWVARYHSMKTCEHVSELEDSDWIYCRHDI